MHISGHRASHPVGERQARLQNATGGSWRRSNKFNFCKVRPSRHLHPPKKKQIQRTRVEALCTSSVRLERTNRGFSRRLRETEIAKKSATEALRAAPKSEDSMSKETCLARQWGSPQATRPAVRRPGYQRFRDASLHLHADPPPSPRCDAVSCPPARTHGEHPTRPRRGRRRHVPGRDAATVRLCAATRSAPLCLPRHPSRERRRPVFVVPPAPRAAAAPQTTLGYLAT